MSQVDSFDFNNQNVARDLRLAGEIGNSLLLRNNELENQLKIANQTSVAQSRDINLLTRQAKALRLTHECRLRIYEDADTSAQTLEQKCLALEALLERYKTENKGLRDVVNNYENEVRDHRLTIQDLERTHRGTLMKTNGEKQDYREAKEASKRLEEVLNVTLDAVREELRQSADDLAVARRRLIACEAVNVRLSGSLDASLAAELAANRQVDAGAAELRASLVECEALRVHHHQRRHYRGQPGDEEDAYDEETEEEIDNVSLLGELLQLKEEVALQHTMCSTVPVANSPTGVTTSDERDATMVTSATSAVSSPPEYKRLFEEIFRTLRRCPTKAVAVDIDHLVMISVATNTD